MAQPTVDMLGSGGAARAAKAMTGRKSQLDELEAEASRDAADPPPGGNNAAFFKGFTPEERARQQKKLAELLRRRE